MTHIQIPFLREMAIAAIDGKKVATTRSERKGEIGDTFQIDNPSWKNGAADFFYFGGDALINPKSKIDIAPAGKVRA